MGAVPYSTVHSFLALKADPENGESFFPKSCPAREIQSYWEAASNLTAHLSATGVYTLSCILNCLLSLYCTCLQLYAFSHTPTHSAHYAIFSKHSVQNALSPLGKKRLLANGWAQFCCQLCRGSH